MNQHSRIRVSKTTVWDKKAPEFDRKITNEAEQALCTQVSTKDLAGISAAP